MSESMEEILWRTVETTAQQILVDVERVYHMPGFIRLLRLWHRPSFGAETSWTVLVPPPLPERPEDAVPIAIELVWERPRDFETIFQPRAIAALPGPTIRMREAFLPPSELASLLARAPTLGLPPGPPTAAPSDTQVESWGVEAHGGGAVLHLEWSDAGPDAWSPSVDWAARFRGLFAYCFDPWVARDALDEDAILERRGGEPSDGDEGEQFGLRKCSTCSALYLTSSTRGVYLDPGALTRVVAEDHFECACASGEPSVTLRPSDTPEGREHPTSATWRDLLRSKLRWAVKPDSIPAYFTPEGAA